MNYEMKGKLIEETLIAFGIEDKPVRVILNKGEATINIEGAELTVRSKKLLEDAAQGTYESDRAYNHKLEASKYGATLKLVPVEPGEFKVTLVVNQFLVPRVVTE